MNEDCGHHCCHIRHNAYHVHGSAPDECERCTSEVSPRVVALTDRLVHTDVRNERVDHLADAGPRL